MNQNYYDDYIVPLLIFSSFILIYLLTFIKPEIEDLERYYQDEKQEKEKKQKKKIKIDPYLPFYMISPLSSPLYIRDIRGEQYRYDLTTTMS